MASPGRPARSVTAISVKSRSSSTTSCDLHGSSMRLTSPACLPPSSKHWESRKSQPEVSFRSGFDQLARLYSSRELAGGGQGPDRTEAPALKARRPRIRILPAKHSDAPVCAGAQLREERPMSDTENPRAGISRRAMLMGTAGAAGAALLPLVPTWVSAAD